MVSVYSHQPKGSLWYLDANVNKFLKETQMQFTVSFELNIDIGIKYIPNIKTSSEYHWNHNRKQDRINEDYCNTGIYLPVYLHLIKEFVCVKDSTCQRVATSSICRSIFGVLFDLSDRMLTLESKTILQSIRKFPCVVWSVGTFPHMDQAETSFLKLHIGRAWKCFR